jgi:hypothetical protein
MAEYEVLDVPIEPPAEGDFEEIPSGIYPGTLVGFRQVEKPAWKIQAELLRKPEKEPDKLQWQWNFEAIVEGAPVSIADYSNRSWHSRSKAAAHACALLDMPVLPVGAGLSTQKLVGRACQIWIVEKPRDDGSSRSYIDKVLPVPKKRGAAPATAPAPVQELPGQTFAQATQQQAPAMAGAAEEIPWDTIVQDDPGPDDDAN